MKKLENIMRERICTELHVREVAEGEAPSREITGYAILFDVPSAPLWADDEEEAREVISPSAITREILDGCDIKMTMFHDRQLILARSKNGEGTLSYEVDEKGVKFSFEAPHTADGDKALELVKRGDIAGCSFAFSTHYYDESFVGRSVTIENGYCRTTYTVNRVTGVYDFTLAADPAYPDTSVEAREFVKALRNPAKEEKPKVNEKMREQVADMRRAAASKIIV